MKLSIVVPVLDEAERIRTALAPLQPFHAAGHELIVVDGGSRDGTFEAALPLADRVLQAPRGRAVQMNVGASVATGDVLLFLHADCRLAPSADVAIAGALARGRAWGRFDVTLDGDSRALPMVASFMNARSAATGICTGDQAMFVERATFDAIGGFPALPLMEDIAISRTLQRLAGPPARLTERVVASGRRWDTRGAWPTILSMWALRWAYWRGADVRDLARRYYGVEPRDPPTLQVFAKAPVPGRVKTRLARTIGTEAATSAYRALAERTLATAAGAGAPAWWVRSSSGSIPNPIPRRSHRGATATASRSRRRPATTSAHACTTRFARRSHGAFPRSWSAPTFRATTSPISRVPRQRSSGTTQ